jgi:serine/threonine protein kinase
VELEAMLEGYLRENAGRYFPELPPGEVLVESEGQRRSRLSTTRSLRIQVGDASRRVVVKFPPADESPQSSSCRARVAPVMDSTRKFESEARTLEVMAEHFEQGRDPRFGVVRLLDFLTDLDAVVMERVPEPTLRELLLRPRFPGGRPRDLAPAFAHVGGWLRCYQAIQGLSHSETRHEGRDDFIETVRLLSRDGDPWLVKVADCVTRAARSELPGELPLGVAHGDFAPRNILVSDSNRVTVLDTRGAWRAPVLEDVGYLLASIWTSGPQAIGFGVAQPVRALARFEQAFLAGYFGDRPVPISEVRLFELQALLDRYASLAEKRQAGRGSSPLRAATHWASERCLRQRILELATGLGGGNFT